MAGNLTMGGYIATPTANTTAAQTAAAQNAGWASTTAATPTSGPVYSGRTYLSPAKTTAPPIPSTIDGSALGTSNPLTLPNTPPLSNPNSLVASATAGLPQPQGTPTDSNSANTEATRTASLNAYLNLAQNQSQEGAAYDQAAQDNQIPQQTQALAALRGTIAQRTAGYAAQWQLANTEHAALPYITGEQTQIQRTQAVELGVLGAQEQAMAGNLQASQDIVNATINHQFEGIKNATDSLGQFIQLNQNNLSSSELADLNQTHDIQKMNLSNLLDTGKQIQNTLAAQGALTPAVATAFSQATSTSDMWNIYNNIINGNSPSAGTSFGNPRGGASTSGIYNGTDWTSYAVNNDGTINQHAQDLFVATSTKIGPITSVQGADTAIKSIAPNSPITGSMIANAVQQYGVDPTDLISRMYTETQLGTDKSKGAKQNNYGNVGNTNSVMAAGNSVKMDSPQAGVNAVAYWMSTHKVAPGQVGQASSQGQSGATFDRLQQSAPPALSAPGILNQTVSGSAYIDTSKVPKDYPTIALASWAKQNNVTLLNSDEVTQVKGIQEAIGNIKNTGAPAWDSIAYDSRLGQIVGGATAFLGNTFDTDTYSNNKTFRDNRESLAQQISALSKSSPRLGLLSTASDALPSNSSYFGTGQGDTYKDGMNKYNRTIQLLNQGLASYLPGDKGVSLLPTSRGGNTPVVPSAANTFKWSDGNTYQITN